MKLFVVGALLLVGCAAESMPGTASATSAATDTSFTWPVPAGWRSETIPFPLGFAPTIAHRGTEELRFAPRFFDATSPTYFTYAFAFVTHDEAPITADVLAADLTTYFHGLASAVTHAPSDPALHDATIAQAKDGVLRGTVHTIDAFGDQRRLTLHLEASTRSCGDRQIVVASLSPRTDEAIWTELGALRAAFACSAASP